MYICGRQANHVPANNLDNRLDDGSSTIVSDKGPSKQDSGEPTAKYSDWKLGSPAAVVVESAMNGSFRSPPTLESAFNMALNASKRLLANQRQCKRRRALFFRRLRDQYRTYDWEGSQYVEEERFDEALPKYKLALELKIRHLVSVTSYDTIKACLLEVATSINNIAFVQQKNEKEFSLSDVAKAYESSLYIKLFLYGSESHLAVGASWNNIGSVHYADKNYKKALYCFRKSRKILREFFAVDHLDICMVTCNIGDVCYRLGDWESAVREYRASLRLRWILLGPYDKKVTELMQRLAFVEMKLALATQSEMRELDDQSCYGDDIDDGSFAAEVNGLNVEIQKDIEFFESALTSAHGEFAKDHLAVFSDLQLLRKSGHDGIGQPISSNESVFEDSVFKDRKKASHNEGQFSYQNKSSGLMDSQSENSSGLLECEEQTESLDLPRSLLDGMDDLAACLHEFDTLLDAKTSEEIVLVETTLSAATEVVARSGLSSTLDSQNPAVRKRQMLCNETSPDEVSAPRPIGLDSGRVKLASTSVDDDLLSIAQSFVVKELDVAEESIQIQTIVSKDVVGNNSTETLDVSSAIYTNLSVLCNFNENNSDKEVKRDHNIRVDHEDDNGHRNESKYIEPQWANELTTAMGDGVEDCDDVDSARSKQLKDYERTQRQEDTLEMGVEGITSTNLCVSLSVQSQRNPSKPDSVALEMDQEALKASEVCNDAEECSVPDRRCETYDNNPASATMLTAKAMDPNIFTNHPSGFFNPADSIQASSVASTFSFDNSGDSQGSNDRSSSPHAPSIPVQCSETAECGNNQISLTEQLTSSKNEQYNLEQGLYHDVTEDLHTSGQTSNKGQSKIIDRSQPSSSSPYVSQRNTCIRSTRSLHDKERPGFETHAGHMSSNETKTPVPLCETKALGQVVPCDSVVESPSSSSSSAFELVNVYAKAKLELELRLQNQRNKKNPSQTNNSNTNNSNNNLTKMDRNDAIQSIRTRLEELRSRRKLSLSESTKGLTV